jgi:hypothetical protein
MAGAAQISEWDVRLAGHELSSGPGGDAASATDYFRTQVAPLVQMRPERDVPPLLTLGTQAAARGAAESGSGPGGGVAARAVGGGGSASAAHGSRWQQQRRPEGGQ